MASCNDLGPLNKLTISQLNMYTEHFFLYSQQNGRVYSSIDKNDLFGIQEKMQGSILNIEEIRDKLLNVGISSSSSMSVPHHSSDITISLLSTPESSTSSILDLIDKLRGSTSIDLSTNTITSLTTVNTAFSFPSGEEINQILSNATHITRSDTGTDGVYFLESSYFHVNYLILKVYSEPDRPMDEEIADRFFQCFGFITPQYHAIKRNTAIGSLACQKLQQLALSGDPSKFSRKQQQLKKRMEEDSMITIMLRIPGIPFGELTYDEMGKVCNANALMALGEMIFLDTVIGNVDRLKENDVNPGNFFLLDPKSALAERKPIALLDHGYGLKSPVLFNKACREVKTLLDEKARKKLKKIMEYFFKNLWRDQLSDDDLIQAAQDSNISHVYNGVRMAADNLVAQFEHNQDAIQSIFVVLNEDERVRHVAQFLDMITYVKKEKDQGV